MHTSNEGTEDSSDDDEDAIPDVWVKRWDTDRNSVTRTGQWWEHQPDHLKVRDVLSSVKCPESTQSRWVIEVVAKKGDYVVALVGDNGIERGKAVGKHTRSCNPAIQRVKLLQLELPNSRKNLLCTDRITRAFTDRKVTRVLDLQGGQDASQKIFNRFHYQPKTNPLYVELEAASDEGFDHLKQE